MKLSEIARYWAAKELTSIAQEDDSLVLHAPFSAPWFTLRIPVTRGDTVPELATETGEPVPLRESATIHQLERSRWTRENGALVVCFDLPAGLSRIRFRR
jgi:hypothetical protein